MLTTTDKVIYALRNWIAVLLQVAIYPFTAGSQMRRQAFRLAREGLRHNLPIVSLASLVNERLSDADKIVLQAVPERVHNCTIFELLALGALARAVSPSLSLEIGTYDGRSALAIATNCAPGARVVTMNLPPTYLIEHPEKKIVTDAALSSKVRSGERWFGTEQAQIIEQVFADSLEFDFGKIGNPQLIFIDGAHDEKSVWSDTKTALRIVDRRNGVIIWHDARDFGIRPVLLQLHREGYPVCIIEHTNMAVLRFVDSKARNIGDS